MIKHLNIQIYGRVQGIFFRTSAKEQADKLGLTGFVQNQPGRSVYLEAEGEKKNLDAFIKWCHKGPVVAQIEKVIMTTGELKNFLKFEIY